MGGLLISPHTRALLHSGFVFSGSPLAAWVASDAAVEKTKQLAAELGRQDGESIKATLKRASTDDIFKALDKIVSFFERFVGNLVFRR